MKTNLRKLRLLTRIIDMNSFYSIDVSAYSVRLQGYINEKTVASLSRLFDLQLDDRGYLVADRGNIHVTLTT